MNIYDLENLFSALYPGKPINYSFDQNCIQQIEIGYALGTVSPSVMVQYNQRAVSVNGDPVVYVSINPHREVVEVCNPIIDLMRSDVISASSDLLSFKVEQASAEAAAKEAAIKALDEKIAAENLAASIAAAEMAQVESTLTDTLPQELQV